MLRLAMARGGGRGLRTRGDSGQETEVMVNRQHQDCTECGTVPRRQGACHFATKWSVMKKFRKDFFLFWDLQGTGEILRGLFAVLMLNTTMVDEERSSSQRRRGEGVNVSFLLGPTDECVSKFQAGRLC